MNAKEAIEIIFYIAAILGAGIMDLIAFKIKIPTIWWFLSVIGLGGWLMALTCDASFYPNLECLS